MRTKIVSYECTGSSDPSGRYVQPRRTARPVSHSPPPEPPSMSDPYARGFAEGFSAGARAVAPGVPATCRIAVVDPGPMFNLNIIKRGSRVKWAENNVERASRHFQYGSEWWVHRRLAAQPAATSTNTSLVRSASSYASLHAKRNAC